ncbi:MAG: hypothetical protein WC107_06645 [Patescibacteria group bacterium]
MVRNDRRTKLLPKIILGQLLVGAIIFCLAIALIRYAQGYRIDFQSFRMIKTAVLVLDYQPKDAKVLLNGKSAKYLRTSFAKNLLPGFYNISVEKEGYTPWQMPLNMPTESVNVFKDIVLFKKEIEISELIDQRKIAILNEPVSLLAQKSENGLFMNSNEIWVGNQLVTRFSTQLKKVIWYSDMYHIVFQAGNEIRVIEKNGMNDTLLATLSQETVATFNINNRGDELYFIDGGQYKIAKIR